MSTGHRAPMGLKHLTVVPENFEPETASASEDPDGAAAEADAADVADEANGESGR